MGLKELELTYGYQMNFTALDFIVFILLGIGICIVRKLVCDY